METEEEEAQLKAYFATGCGSEMRTWLLHKGIDQTDVGSIVLRFLKPEYGVKTLLELFALALTCPDPLALMVSACSV